jgi:rRNA maturation RNase YbeY
MNVKYLGHHTYTDIITFSHSEISGVIDGEVFISIPRVKDNSSSFRVLFENELHRVIIHGVLHLIGYSDKTALKKQEMRKKEDAYLSLFF